MTAPDFNIRLDDLTHPDVIELLRFHVAEAHRNSPPGAVFALDLAGLRKPGLSLWTAWHGEALAGMAALNVYEPGRGELKSMRTHQNFLRQGVAALMLRHVIAAARAQNLRKLSLETGNSPSFDPARALYARHGFVTGGAYAGYAENGHSVFMHLTLG